MRPSAQEYPTYATPPRPEEAEEQAPPPGQMQVVMVALAVGVLLMGIQLWLLTVALELYLAGNGESIWLLALISGAIFLGGLLMLWLLRRSPRVRRTSTVDYTQSASPPGGPPQE